MEGLSFITGIFLRGRLLLDSSLIRVYLVDVGRFLDPNCVVKGLTSLSIPLRFVVLTNWDRTKRDVNSNILEENLLLVEIVIGSNIVWYLVALHVEDLCSRNLVSVFNRALALLLINDRSVDDLLNC